MVYVVECVENPGWKVCGAFVMPDDAQYLADDLAGPTSRLTVRVTRWDEDGTSAVVYRTASGC